MNNIDYIMNNIRIINLVTTGLPRLLGGSCFLVMMLIATRRRGNIAWLMLPFTLYCLLWTSWSSLRIQLVYWNDQQNSSWFSLDQWGSLLVYWLCLILALTPCWINGKTPDASTQVSNGNDP